MTYPKTISALARPGVLRILIAFLAVACFVHAGWIFYVRHQDEQAIKAAVAENILSKPGTGVFIEELTDWVYSNQGFAKNRQYFQWQALGPTPRQVYDGGGDCADKSRLMSIVLRLYGIDSSLVTLLGCAQCGPTHVVVEARYKEGWMVADPVFDLVFPKEEFSYYGVRELRSNPSLLSNRLDELLQSRGPRSKVSRYQRGTETYTYAQYINWDKVPLAKTLAPWLSKAGIDLYEVRRPWFLEDPQFIMGGLWAAGGLLFSMLYLILRLFWKSPARDSAPPLDPAVRENLSESSNPIR